MTAPISGWYEDPDQPGMVRYWDGQAWTEQTAPAQPVAPAPAANPVPQPQQHVASPQEPVAEEQFPGAPAGYKPYVPGSNGSPKKPWKKLLLLLLIALGVGAYMFLKQGTDGGTPTTSAPTTSAPATSAPAADPSATPPATGAEITNVQVRLETGTVDFQPAAKLFTINAATAPVCRAITPPEQQQIQTDLAYLQPRSQENRRTGTPAILVTRPSGVVELAGFSLQRDPTLLAMVMRAEKVLATGGDAAACKA